MPQNQQLNKKAYEKYLNEVMQLCDAEEKRLQESMYDLRKVRRYWRDIDYSCESENVDEDRFNNKSKFNCNSKQF